MTDHPAVAVTANLLARCAAAPALAKVRQFDGPPYADIEDPDVLAVGVTIDDVVAAYGATAPGHGDSRSEQFDLVSLVQSWSGDASPRAVAARRARAFALLDAVRSVLAVDVTVGGACDRAYLSTWSYRPARSTKGVLALIQFAVRVDATRFGGS